MKFKHLKDEQAKELSVLDHGGDTLRLKRFDDEKGRPDKDLYAYINNSVGVRLTKNKALKLAYAILAELDPV